MAPLQNLITAVPAIEPGQAATAHYPGETGFRPQLCAHFRQGVDTIRRPQAFELTGVQLQLVRSAKSQLEHLHPLCVAHLWRVPMPGAMAGHQPQLVQRSEERRVGEEWRARGGTDP